jgi:hypothetical protein
LAVSIDNSSAATQNAQVEVTYATPQNLSSAIISMWIYVDNSLNVLPAWTTATQPFANPPWMGNWQGLGSSATIPTNTWVNVAVTLTSAATTVTQFGFQLTSVGPGASGHVYIDAVTITIPTVPTATPTSTATTSIPYLEGSSYSLTNWSVSPTGATTLTALSLIAPGYGTSTDGAGVSVTWSGTGQTVNIQYSYGTYTSWTALGVTGFRAWTYSNPVHSTSGGLQQYCQSGSTSSEAWENSSWTGASASWQQVSWTPPFSASGSSPVSVDDFGIQFGTGSAAGTYSTDMIEISNVELY